MQRQALSRWLLAAAVGVLSLAPLQSPRAADEFAVRMTTVEDRKAVFGTVESVKVAAARTRIGGTISGLSVTEGTSVRKGQPIALVEDPKLRLQIEALQARIQSQEAQRELAQTAFDRVEQLYRGGTVSKARLDEAQTNLDVATRQLAAMKADRDVVLQRRAEGVVLAPADGRVLKVNVTAGTNVQPGEEVATLTAEAYILRIQLPERHARFIHEGQKVLVGGRGLGASMSDAGAPTRTGVIRQVYPEIRQGRVVADVDVDGLGDFFVGERASVYVAAGERSVFIVPPAFLFQRFGVTYARVKGLGDTVVQTGMPRDDGVEVLSGLKDGDVLVTPEAAR